MKQQFINSLKDIQTLFSDNEVAFAELPEDLFEPFNANWVTLDNHQHHWNEVYFNAKAVDLDINFSKELVLHLIAVKKDIQGKQDKVVNPVQNTPDTTDSTSLTSSVDISVAEPPSLSSNINLANFKPNNRLLGFLNDKDDDRVRSYLMSILNNRRLSLEEVFKSIWYVHTSHPYIFKEEEDSAFVQAINYDENAWNFEYFNLQQVYLNENFTLVRLLHLANVRETLMNRGDKDFQQIHVKKDAIAPKAEPVNTESKPQPITPRPAETVEPKDSGHTQTSDNQYTHTTSTSQNNTFVKTLMIVGGAILAIGAIIFAITR